MQRGFRLAVVALGGHEAEFRVSQDVVIRAADAVFGGADQQVAVVGAGLPPHRQVGAHLAQRQALVEQLVAEHLFPHLAEQLHPVQRARRSLLRDGQEGERRVHRGVWRRRRRRERGNERCTTDRQGRKEGRKAIQGCKEGRKGGMEEMKESQQGDKEGRKVRKPGKERKERKPRKKGGMEGRKGSQARRQGKEVRQGRKERKGSQARKEMRQ